MSTLVTLVTVVASAAAVAAAIVGYMAYRQTRRQAEYTARALEYVTLARRIVEVEAIGGDGYALRNVSGEILEQVTLLPDHLPGPVIPELTRRTLLPGEAVRFTIQGVTQSNYPLQIWVKIKGSPAMAIPCPRPT
ncbi:hypothetical protein OIE43_22330 [Streptomyces pseudovenezuelae]|uniref:hypothetical protein n=1 Tax=Streptomyces pseudovenezuelae TaxID=67350 RepID=UPI002E331BA2|nr:hypothetical protein [Streptomyces pseudovenezuelae]